MSDAAPLFDDSVESSDGSQPLSVLVVDDDAVNRMILQGMLEDSGYKVLLAENGEQAIAAYSEYLPDMILMDIMMPGMDGYEATTRIKSLCGDQFLPIIFLTAVTNEEELAKCVTVGGDDFLTKPFSKVILLAKIKALTRMRSLYSTIRLQRDEIDIHNEHMLREQKVAKKIFSRVVHEGCLDIPCIRYLLSPLSVFNGDLLLAARTPSGGINVLLGDATGHGLPAAIGAVPISDIFYAMSETGATVDEIVLELNHKLKSILPPEFFFCASILNISSDFRLMTVWHGALPDMIVYSAADRVISHKIRSANFPLGVVSNDTLQTKLTVVELHKGDRIFLYSDGITEARNIEQQEFGEVRLLRCFEQNMAPQDLFSHIVSSITEFRAGHAQSDDVTLLELIADESLLADDTYVKNINAAVQYPQKWHVQLQIRPQEMRSTNPVSLLTKFITQSSELIRHRENIFIILSELYNNALDHGVLHLDSALKQQREGFLKYLTMRQERLEQLDDGHINIRLAHENHDAHSGTLCIDIQDSGPGFDYQQLIPGLQGNDKFSGRGLALVKSLCQEFAFHGNGNEVKVLYVWHNQQ